MVWSLVCVLLCVRLPSQGTLLFCLLLLAIWAPLLLFSSGAPTYQTPGIVGARVNASFGVVTSRGHYQGMACCMVMVCDVCLLLQPGTGTSEG